MQESASYSMPDEDLLVTSAGIEESFSTIVSSAGGKRKAASDTESPRQTKTGRGMKRGGATSTAGVSGGKQTRSHPIGSPISD